MFETLGVASRAREIAMVMPRFRDSLVCAGGSVGVGWDRGGGGGVAQSQACGCRRGTGYVGGKSEAETKG